jgi:hypothetical protein
MKSLPNTHLASFTAVFAFVASSCVVAPPPAGATTAPAHPASKSSPPQKGKHAPARQARGNSKQSKPLIKLQWSPAKWRGKPNCGSKFPARGRLGKAFLHVWNNTCWSCPAGYRRALAPNVAGGRACVKKGAVRYARATRHAKARGLLRTSCPKGSRQFLHIGDGHCYSCPAGYHRTLRSIRGSRACKRREPKRWARGTKRGSPGCPHGAFRNFVLNQCYSCPAGYGRSLTPGVDLTKVKSACVKVAVNLPRINIKPPGNIGARARRALRRHDKLIKLAARQLPALQARFKKTGKLDKLSTDENLDQEAERAGINAIGIGLVADASSPYAIGGNGTVELVHSTRRWSGIKKLVTLSVTATVPGSAGADAQLQLGFYTPDVNSLDGFSFIVEGGYAKKYGVGVSAIFGVQLAPFRIVFLGFTVSAGVGFMTTGFEGDVGLGFGFYL